jgi:hypothetical protein
MGEGNYQYLIQGVYSINALSGKGKKLKEITVNRYLNLLKLPIIKKEEYFFIVNDYLYVTNPSVKAVRISANFEEDIPNEIMFPDCDCGTKYSKEELCKNPLDNNANIPGYLENQVLDIVSQKLLQTYFNLPVDKTENSVDGQSPNSTTKD